MKLARVGTLRFLCDRMPPPACGARRRSSASCAGRGLDRPAADAPDGPLRADVVRVREAQDRDTACDALGVHALEAAPRHPRRRAVASVARDAEARRRWRPGASSGSTGRRAGLRAGRSRSTRARARRGGRAAGGEPRDLVVPGVGQAPLAGGASFAGAATRESTSSRDPQIRFSSSLPSRLRTFSGPPPRRRSWKRSSEPTRPGPRGASVAAALPTASSSTANVSLASSQSSARRSRISFHWSTASIGRPAYSAESDLRGATTRFSPRGPGAARGCARPRRSPRPRRGARAR